AAHEAMRDLVWARLDAVHALRRARQQLSGFLLRQGCHYGRLGPSCIAVGGRGSASSRRSITLCWRITSRRSRAPRRGPIDLTTQIEAMLPDWTLAPVVVALQTMRGMALVNA